jgi:hypothetical protein
MKSLEQIKNEYALSKKFKSWENFCFVANDNMFVRAVDEIATLYAEYCARFIISPRQMIRQLQSEHLGTGQFG